MAYETLLVERHGPVGWLVFNRPGVANAMDATMLAELEAFGAAALLAQRFGITTELRHVEAGLERVTRAGVHDHAHLGIVIELEPRVGELVAHVAGHRVQLVGTVEDQPAHVALPLDDQGVVPSVTHLA